MKALNKIDVRSVYNEERGGFGPLRAPKAYPKRRPSVETNENNEILFIDKSTTFDRRLCVQPERTAHGARLKRWSIGSDRATRASRAD
jgi:hypothetical protein